MWISRQYPIGAEPRLVETKSEEGETASLLANVFSGRWSRINWVVRTLLVGAIVPHELGHVVAGPGGNYKRRDYAIWILRGLLNGVPWEARGPRVLAGLLANGAFAGLAVFGLMIATSNAAREVLYYLLASNMVVLLFEPMLSLIMRRGDVAHLIWPDEVPAETTRRFHQIQEDALGKILHDPYGWTALRRTAFHAWRDVEESWDALQGQRTLSPL